MSIQALSYHNIGGGYDNTDYTFTTPITGAYLFYFSLLCKGSNSFGVDLFLYDPIEEVETQQIRLASISINSSSSIIARSTTMIVNCIVGEKVYVKRDFGTVTLNGESGSLGNVCNFGGYLLG